MERLEIRQTMKLVYPNLAIAKVKEQNIASKSSFAASRASPKVKSRQKKKKSQIPSS